MSRFIDIPKAVKNTKQIEPFDKADLAQIILKVCPTDWQNQYSLSQGIIPQDMQSLLDVPEVIENGDGNKKKEGYNGGKSGDKSKKGKKKTQGFL